MILIMFHAGFAQNQYEDTFVVHRDKYIQQLKQYPNPDTNRAKTLYMITDKCIFTSQRKQVMQYALESFELSKKLNYKKGLAQSYFWFGSYHKGLSEYDKAQLYFDSVIMVLKGGSVPYASRTYSHTYRLKGKIYQQIEEYPLALEAYIKALPYIEKQTIKDVNAAYYMYIYKDIAFIYTYLNNHEKAIEYSEIFLKECEKYEDLTIKLDAYCFAANMYLKQGKTKEALVVIEKAKPFMPDTIEVNITYAYYLILGQIAALEQKKDLANTHFKTALYYAEKSKHGLSANEVLNQLFANSLALGDLGNARKYAEENLLIAKELDNKLDKIGALANLSAYYKRTGNYRKAYETIFQSMTLKDSLMAEESIKQINKLESRYQRDKKERAILELQKEKEIGEITIRSKSQLNILLGTVIFILMMMGFLGYKYARKRQEVQQQKIVELEKDKHILTIDAMLKGQEDERSRLAKDLHDGLGGMLSGIKLSLVNMKEKTIMTPGNMENFERAIQLMDASIKELRHVAHNLMPEALVKLGLKEALSDFCSMIQTSSEINIIYQFLGEDRTLGNTPNVYIYRIIQELVNNSLKYAHATEIIVQVVIDEKNVNITIEDNGIGFDINTLKNNKGMGLSNIQSRVDYFQGIFDVHAAPNSGTSINIILKV